MKTRLLLTLIFCLMKELKDTTGQALQVQFEQSKYTFSESDISVVSPVCVSLLNTTLEREVIFLLQDTNGTAQAPTDYSSIFVFGSFQPLQETFCLNATQHLIDDDVVENTEIFTINFIADTTDTVITVIYITDNDGATFKLVNTINEGFTADIFAITESNTNTTFSITIELVSGGEVNGSQNGLGRDAVLLVSAEEGIAGSTDFIPVSNMTVTFPVGSVNSDRVTGEILILGDMFPESAELFEFFVSTVNPMDRLEGPTRARVIIQNDDIIPDCGQPPSPGENGLVLYNSTLLGANADYVCNNGYQTNPPGMERRFCLLSGNWSGMDLTCELVDCGPLGDPASGLVLVNGTVFGSQALYSCDVGHQLSGNNSRTCQSDGLWSGLEPTCQAVDCGDLPTLVNGLISINDTTFNSTASYSCNMGYELVGNTTRICQANGNWSGSQPSCIAVDCGNLTDPLNGVVNHNSTTFLSGALYSCDVGFSLSGESSRQCLSTGQWSGSQPVCQVVDCGDLPTLVNGLISINDTTFNSTASYSCDMGYELVGNTTRTCQANGNWSGSQPSCIVVGCGNLTDPLNGVVNHNTTTFLSGALYSCDVGFSLSGESSRQCLSTGQWSGSEPVCQDIDECGLNNSSCVQTCSNSLGSFLCGCYEGYQLANDTISCNTVDCGNLPTLVNGLISINDTTFNSTSSYSCNMGYELVGNTTRICQANGNWSGSQPSCIVVDCGPLGDPASGLVLVNGTVFGSQALYSCDVGHQLSGNNSRICQSDGLWFGLEPTCQVVDCGPLPNITGGTVQLRNGSKLSSTAVYSCNDGYAVQEGDILRTCLINGQWSGISLVCIRGGTPDLGAGMSNVIQTSIDILVLAISVSVGGFSIAVIITAVIILLSVRRARLRGNDRVYSLNYNETVIRNDTSLGDQELTLSRENERPIYATLHQLPS